MSKFTQVSCFYCKTVFTKENRFFNRSEKLQRKHYCSMSCASKARIFNNPKLKKNIKRGSNIDVYSPFRRMLGSCKSRVKISSLDFNLSLYDLYDLYNKQNGLCALSGIKMLLPTKTAHSLNRNPFMISLDRIDSNSGYTKDNIQFVCLMAQYAKNVYTKNDLDVFCKNYYLFNKLGE